MLRASPIPRVLAAAALAALAVAPAAPALAAGSVAAQGYVAPPYWAAYTHAGIAVLTYAKVDSQTLGSAGGPKGTQTQVPVGVHLVSASGKALRNVITVPKGWAVLSATATEDGVAVTAGPLSDVSGLPAPSTRPWQLIVSDLSQGQRVAWRYTPGSRLEAPPALGSAGAYWAAVTQQGAKGKVPDTSVLAEGRFASGAARVFTAKADMLATGVAVEPTGKVGLYGLEYTGSHLQAPAFAKAAGIALLWTGHGVLVSAPGGFLTVVGSVIARPGAGGKSLPIGRLPKGTSVVGVSGDGVAVVLLLASRKGDLTTWAIGPAPKALNSVLSIHPSQLYLTAAGVVGVTLHLKNRTVTVSYAAVAAS